MRTSTLLRAAVITTAAAWGACSTTPPETIVVQGGTTPGRDAGDGDGWVPLPDGGRSVLADGGRPTLADGAPADGAAATAGDGGNILPCDLATYLSTACTACHSDPPIPSALSGLVTYDDLLKPSVEDPTKNEAQLSLARMQNAASPMPPGAPPAAANITILQTWINAGYPSGPACTTPPPPPPPSDAGPGDAGAATGVPCDVATYLASACTGCHSDPPTPSALRGLVTYSDLMAMAVEDPTKNEAQMSLFRMQSTTSPMPPGAPPSAADIAILQNWINAGYPQGSCDGGAPPPPPSVFDNAPPFASQTGPRTHNAGGDCVGCHNGGGGGGDAPHLVFGGTLYDGSGVAVAGAEVRFVDANGVATSVYTSASGTFYLRGSGFAAPARVGVRNATSAQNMNTPLQSGSQPPASSGGACSACHCTGSSCTVRPIHLP